MHVKRQNLLLQLLEMMLEFMVEHMLFLTSNRYIMVKSTN